MTSLDIPPAFGDRTIPVRRYATGVAITNLTLPKTTDGKGGISHRMVEPLPAELTFDAGSRTLIGTPTATQAALPYTYRVTDADENHARRPAGLGHRDPHPYRPR